jgi:hypothetical protein
MEVVAVGFKLSVRGTFLARYRVYCYAALGVCWVWESTRFRCGGGKAQRADRTYIPANAKNIA